MTSRRALLCVLTIVAAASVACSGSRQGSSHRLHVTHSRPPRRAVVAAAATPLPSATGKEEDESYERTGGRLGGLWRGGRHPQWRGCRHTFQPTLSAWIFGSSGGASAPPAT